MNRLSFSLYDEEPKTSSAISVDTTASYCSDISTDHNNGRDDPAELLDDDPLSNLGDIGGAITYIRESMGLNQKELVEKLDIGASSLCMIESSKRLPTLVTLSSIALALGGVPVHAILLKAKALADPSDILGSRTADTIISMHVKIYKAKETKFKVSTPDLNSTDVIPKHYN